MERSTHMDLLPPDLGVYLFVIGDIRICRFLRFQVAQPTPQPVT